MNIVLGNIIKYIEEKLKNEQKRMSLEADWKVHTFRDTENSLMASSHILPVNILTDRNFTFYIKSLNCFNITSVLWKSKIGSYLLKTRKLNSKEYKIEEDDLNFIKTVIKNIEKIDEKTTNVFLFDEFQDYKRWKNKIFESQKIKITTFNGTFYQCAIKESLLYKENYSPFERLQATGRMTYISIYATYKISNILRQGNNVILEDSVTFEISNSMAALIMCINDEYYCTREGFIVLLERLFINLSEEFLNNSSEQDFRKVNKNEEYFRKISLFCFVIRLLCEIFPECFDFDKLFIDKILDNLFNNDFFPFEDSNKQKFVFMSIVETESKCKNKTNIQSIYDALNKYEDMWRYCEENYIKFMAIFYEKYFEKYSKKFQRCFFKNSTESIELESINYEVYGKILSMNLPVKISLLDSLTYEV